MTFREIVGALDAQGEYGAKRPSMRGYAYKRADGDGEGSKAEIVLLSPDGSETKFVVDGRVASPEDPVTFDSLRFEAFVFASDWELSKKDELEKARVGGEM